MSSATVHHLLGAIVASAAAVALTAGTAFAGVSGPAFYVDGVTYRTVGTPTDLTGTGAPPHTFDMLYDFSGAQLNVAEAAPGDRDYNGGRWMVHALEFPNGYDAAVTAGDLDGDGVLDSIEEVDVALAAGAAIDLGVVKMFVCPVIKLPKG